MLFKWSSAGNDIRYLDLSIRSLHQFYPNETYVVCYNGPMDEINAFRSNIAHLPIDKVLVIWDYDWPFAFDLSSGYWKKYVPHYVEEFGGTQFHIDNDILFIKKPARFENFTTGIYLTPDRDHDVPCDGCCNELCEIMTEKSFTPVNSGVFGLESHSQKYFLEHFFRFANQLHESGLKMEWTTEQATLALFAQDSDLSIHWETPDYIANAYSLQRYVDFLHKEPWVTVHFMSYSKILFDNFYSFFAEHVFNWNNHSLEIFQSLLRLQELGAGIHHKASRKDRKMYYILREKESGLTDPNSSGIIEHAYDYGLHHRR